MCSEKSQVGEKAVRALVVSFCLLCLFFPSTSCRDKSGNDDIDTTSVPPWNQMKIDWFAAWSPDGSKIIYTRDPADGARDTSWQWGAFVHNIASGTDSCIWPGVLFDGFAWSPDSRAVAYCQNAQIYVHEFDSHSTNQITHSNRNFGVRWTPCRDKLIFFVRANDGGLFVYDFEQDSITHVIDRIQSDAGDWLPNCSTLVLLDSCIFTDCAVVTYDLYSKSVRVISRIPGTHRDVAVSPDGMTAVFSAQSQLWSVPVSGGLAKQLTTEGGDYPDWSPDGQWIVYTKIDRRNGYLWLMRPDGSEKHQITF